MKRQRHMKSITYTLCVACVALTVTGCATLTEAEREHRVYVQQEFEEQFRACRGNCHSQRGHIVIYASDKVDRDGIPHLTDPVFCAKFGGLERFGPISTRVPTVAAMDDKF